jgi:multisubunit Na+/H+ antiporter MnhB subunit
MSFAIQFVKVVVLPLLVAVLASLATVAFACMIAYGRSANTATWYYLGLVSVPEYAKTRVFSATIVLLVLVSIVYCSHLLGLASIARQNRMNLLDLIKLPSSQRTRLINDSRRIR